MIYSFGIQSLKSLIDSGIICVCDKTAALNSINIIGKNVDISLFGNQILYVSYALIIIKVLVLNLNYVNYLHFIFTFLCIACLYGITYLDSFYHDSVIYGITHFNIILSNILIIFYCCLYEIVAKYILFLLNYDFISKLTIIFKENMSKLLFLKEYKDLLNIISSKIPRIPNQLSKISLAEVLDKIHTRNKQLDPALENLADVSNDEVSNLKIRKPILKYFDEKIEKDYIEYCDLKVTIPYIIYLFSLILFIIVDLVIRGFEPQKISKMIYITCGFFLLIPKLKERFSKIFPYYLAIIIVIELLFIYINKNNNDVKICLQMSIIIYFPLFYCPKNKIIIIMSFIYIIGITPALFINDFGLNSINQIYHENFLYKNLCLIYLRQMSIYGIAILLLISSYYTQLNNRIEFLKYYKSKIDLKKDDLIMSNLIPQFVRAKKQRGIRGAAYGHEEVTIVFCDISNFDSLMAKLSPKDIILMLDQFYSILDKYCQIHGLQKIETVGKTYMAAGGIKECEMDIDKNLLTIDHSIRCFEFAKDILDLIEKMIFDSGDRIHAKIGIHVGKVIPAVVGSHKPQFSLIGDTVNTTSRMSSIGEIDRITCSIFAIREIKEKYNKPDDYFEIIGKMNIKGKEPMDIYLFPKTRINLNKRKSIADKEQSNYLKSNSSLLNNNNFSKLSSKLIRKNFSNIINNDTIKDNCLLNKTINNQNEVEYSMQIIDNSNEKILAPQDNAHKNIFVNLNLVNNYISDSNFKISDEKNNKNSKKEAFEKKEPKFENFGNDFFKDSFLLFAFKKGKRASKKAFGEFEKIMISKSLKKSVLINMTLFVLLLYSIYSVTHYAKINDYYFSYLSIKSAIVLMLIIFIFLTDKLVETFPKINFILLTLTYLSISYVNMFYNEKLNTFNLLNITVEEIVILTAIESCSILNYLELIINILLHIVIYIIDIVTNKQNVRIRDYNIFLITIAVIKLINIITSYYDTTKIFITSQKESKALKDTEKTLFNLLPLHVVQNMKDDIPVADVLENTTLLYADIVNFTKFSDEHQPIEVVALLMSLFERFDNAAKECNVYKVHTIGDCYVVMGFNGKVNMTERDFYEEAKNVCEMGQKMIEIIKVIRKQVNHQKLDMRIGIHTGTVVAGIIGSSVVRYDIFGKDVLIANKMESEGSPGKINISIETKKLLESKGIPFNVTYNKEVHIGLVEQNIQCYLIEENTNEVIK